ncbi:hypothetical protein BAE44_0022095, partial [Dichanthelium oligosanthes]
ATTRSDRDECRQDDRGVVRVANPPGLSRCFVSCPDLTPDDHVPCVTDADDAFLLVNVILTKRPRQNDRGGQWTFTDVFVYRAGPGAPLLHLLPRPYPVSLHANHVGVLSCGEHCLIVMPKVQFEADGFSTETESWSTKAARVACDLEWHGVYFHHTKVFSIGGSSLAWVDLRHDILLCDELGENHPTMRLIQLPPLTPTNKVTFRSSSDGTMMPPLDLICDVTCTDGWFRFVKMEGPESDGDGSNTITQFRWTATMSKTMTCSANWELCGTINSADLSATGSCFLPEFGLEGHH